MLSEELNQPKSPIYLGSTKGERLHPWEGTGSCTWEPPSLAGRPARTRELQGSRVSKRGVCLCYLAAKQNTEGLALSCHFTARPLLVCTALSVETQASADRHGERTWFGYAEISRRACSVVWAISGGRHGTGHRPTKGAPINTGRPV